MATAVSLQDVHSLYQPIVEIRGSSVSLYGAEALSRGPVGSTFFEPLSLFGYFRSQGQEHLLERRCMEAAIEGAKSLPANAHISINVLAPTLARCNDFAFFFLDMLERAQIDPKRVILEINEGAPIRYTLPDVLKTLDKLRSTGLRIALDDLGEGYANYRMILDLRPDYLKIDRYFIHEAANDAGRQAIITSITELANWFGAKVIAEGVEQADDFLVAAQLGIRLFQGYLFSKPVAVGDLGTRFVSVLEKRGFAAGASRGLGLMAARGAAH